MPGADGAHGTSKGSLLEKLQQAKRRMAYTCAASCCKQQGQSLHEQHIGHRCSKAELAST